VARLHGEIYNFQALRRELEGRGTRSGRRRRRDGPPPLREHGTDALRFLRGMFAFALWTASFGTLFVGRDRLGQKPLVYYHDDECSSSPRSRKAILQHPPVRPRPIRGAQPVPGVGLLLTRGRLPASASSHPVTS